MEADGLSEVRIRAHAAGLDLDDGRLAMLNDLLREFMGMMEAIEKIEVDPTDLALEPFEPGWSDVERSR